MPKSNLEIIQSTYEGSASSNAKHLAEASLKKWNGQRQKVSRMAEHIQA